MANVGALHKRQFTWPAGGGRGAVELNASVGQSQLADKARAAVHVPDDR